MREALGRTRCTTLNRPYGNLAVCVRLPAAVPSVPMLGNAEDVMTLVLVIEAWGNVPPIACHGMDVDSLGRRRCITRIVGGSQVGGLLHGEACLCVGME